MTLSGFHLMLQGAATEEFLPHGFCFLWNKPLLWTHVVSDVLIGAAYVTISVSLAWLVLRARRDIPFSAAFVMFGVFIVACGLTHFLEVVTFWNPVYVLLGGVKVVTAAASVATAIAMPFVVPRVHGTIRDARLSREREVAAARAEVLEQSNAELQRLNDELQVALADAESARRAAEEARNSAEEARRNSDEANRAKAEFLAVMSHELRTPLNAVMGYTDLLTLGITGPVNAAQVGQLDQIRDSASHLVRLIEQILHFARIEAGRETVVTEHFDAAAEVSAATELLRPLAEQKGLSLEIVLPRPGRAMMHSDSRLIRQAVLNIISNAIKYTARGSVSVAVERVETDRTLRIRCTDTGIGIATEHQARVFEPFWQAAAAHTRLAGGTGLGLSVTSQIVEMLGGEVHLESTLGAGSSFTLILPVELPEMAVA